MRKTDIPVLEIVAVAALVVIAFTVVLLLFPNMRSEAGAGWTQAFGAIVAVAVAIWVPWDQHNKAVARDEKRQKDEKRDTLGSMYQVMARACELINAMPHNRNDPDDVQRYLEFEASRSAFSDVIRVLKEAPLYKSGDYLVISMVLDMIEAATQSLALLDVLCTQNQAERFTEWPMRASQIADQIIYAQVALSSMRTYIDTHY